MVAEVDEVLVRHRHEALVQDGEAADARVEDADGPGIRHGAIVGSGVLCARVRRLLLVAALLCSGPRPHRPSRKQTGRADDERRHVDRLRPLRAGRRARPQAAGRASSCCTGSAARRTAWRRSRRSSSRRLRGARLHRRAATARRRGDVGLAGPDEIVRRAARWSRSSPGCRR